MGCLLNHFAPARSDLLPDPFPTALRFKNSTEFSDHLARKSKEIKNKVNELFANLAAASSSGTSEEVAELQKKVTSLLALQKEHLLKNDRLKAEKSELGERLETASLRYLKSEKKLDRLKSEPVAKVEAAAIATSTNNGVKEESDKANGMNGIEYSSAESEATQLAYKEAQAALEKQKQQLDAVMAENKSLTEQLTTASTKLTNLTDDDYARTDLFKSFKIQHEDVIKRINSLEATNIQLREEAEKLQAERTAFKSQLEMEADSANADLESQVQRLESDLTRIRSARDELIADQSTRKAHQDQEKEALGQMKELCGAKDERISGLESEVERLRAQIDEHSAVPTPQTDVNDIDVDELRRKYIVLEQSFASVNNELPAMEKAYKRSMALASKKVMDFTAMEEKVTLLIAEKSKADQKYFAARKDMDVRIGEVRAIRAQNAKSSEIISQLKDVEAANKSLITSLEKQLAELRQGNAILAAENKRALTASADATSKVDALKSQIAEMATLLKTKDAAYSSAKQHIHTIEVDLEKLQVKLDAAIKEKDVWKAKGLSNSSADEEMLRVSTRHCQNVVAHMLTRFRLWLCAPSVEISSRILCSRDVAIFSATHAWKTA